jgi:hypothetical protein
MQGLIEIFVLLVTVDDVEDHPLYTCPARALEANGEREGQKVHPWNGHSGS